MKSFQVMLSRFCWALTFIVCAVYFGRFGKEAYNFYGDALGYYMYLPSTFIYDNHKSIERLPTNRGIRPFIHSYASQMGSGQRTPKGYVLNQYTYGVALMEAPFFFAAHAWEKLSGGPANGFSAPYRFAILCSTLVYGALGLWLTYRLLRRRFPAHLASLTTALLLLGTNLFWFTMQQHGMAHVPLFFLFALLMHLTVRIHESGRWTNFAALGLTAGLITVIRPMDMLCVLIPVFYAPDRPFLKTKLDFVRRHWAAILLAGCSFILPIIPQLLYWKWLTGYTIYDSYGPGQGFDFRHSHVWSGLFGPSNGWLFYTPLMVMAILGLACVRRLGPFALGIPLFLGLYVFGIYAWFLPNYPNGLGSRPMVDAYAVLALPLAASLQWIGSRGRIVWAAGALFVAGCVAINLSYSLQQVLGIICSQDSKYAFNFQTLFRYNTRYNDLVVWDTGIPQPDAKSLQVIGAPVCTRIADSAVSDRVITDSVGRKFFEMKEGEEYGSPTLSQGYSPKLPNVRWIRCSGRFMVTKPEHDIYQNHLLVLQIKRGTETIVWQGVRINNKVGLLEHADSYKANLFLFREGIWGQVSYFIPVPKDMKTGDVFQLDVWNIGKKPIYISELCMEFFE